MLNLLKNHILKRFIGYFESDLGGLLFGMFLGDDHYLKKELSHYFSVIGMQHVVAASGFNVGLILGTAKLFVSRFWGIGRTLCLVGAVFFYVILAGASPSLLRASTQAVIVLFGTKVGKKRIPTWWALGVTLLLLSCISFSLWQEIGFQLSVLSTLSVMMADKLFPLGDLKNETWFAAMVIEVAQLTMVVQLITFPLVWFHFGSVSLLTLPANTLLLWMTPYLTYLSMVGVVVVIGESIFPFESIWFGVAIVLRVISWFFGGLFIQVVSLFGQWENTVLELPAFNIGITVTWYGLIASVCILRIALKRKVYKGLL